MEVEKHNSSDTSSDDESDHRTDDNNVGVGRSYECAFCKRGFTNAQALGGHMNIHRKDKLKAAAKKNNHQESSLSRNFNCDHHHQQRYYYYSDSRAAASAAQHVSYQFNYLPPPNPSYQQAYHHPNEYHMSYGGFMGANDLSLRVGPTNVEEEEGEEGRNEESDEENEVDLELRLGYHKYR